MKKLLKEFKDFINRGSVLDLAVGMIIGGAFTAIITAVVTGILQPLINMIPLGDGKTLQVVLRDPQLAEDGITIIKEAVIIDFGAVISAIITFLCTALVLFLVIKAINSAKKAADKAKEEAEKLKKKEEEAAPAVEEAPAAPAEPVETSDDVLKEIRDLLKSQASKEE
ncbi:MAG: large conductance mechanosensitive channel protein MscL [Clostridia bacterium]|nr:large conductance mechanosensitive channel protein MscL [Clostridia bacterium]